MSDKMQVGKPKYGNTKKNNWKQKDGDNVYRVLPPVGSLAESGEWAVYEAIHWGYLNSQKQPRPFRCVQQTDRQTKKVKVECEECNLISKNKKKYDEQFKELTEVKKMSKDEAKTVLKPLSDWLYAHNLDRKWHMNVLNLENQIGKFSTAHRMKKALEDEIAKLLKRNIDPLAPEDGVYFNFNRSGTGSETRHNVSVVTHTIKLQDGTQADVIKKAPLTEEHLSRIPREAFDLTVAFRTITPTQVKMLVNSKGSFDVVDSIFGAATVSDSDEENETESTTEQTVTPVTEPNPVTQPSEVKSNNEETEIAAEIARLQAKLTTSKATVKVDTSNADVSNIDEMSAEEFLAKYRSSTAKT